jgi:hypothetical protein
MLKVFFYGYYLRRRRQESELGWDLFSKALRR